MSKKYTRVFDFTHQQTYSPVNKYLNQKKDGKWVSLPIKKFIEKVNTLSRALLKTGIQKGDTIISLISKNSTEWGVADIACMQIGVINVTLSSDAPSIEIEAAFQEIEPKLCFVSDSEAYEKLRIAESNLPDSKIYSFEDSCLSTNWAHLLQIGISTENQKDVVSLRDSIKASDIATVVYTAGTTSMPKAVMLSHRSIVESIKAISKAINTEKSTCKRAMSYLPVSSMIERMAVYYYQYMKYEVYFSSGKTMLENDLKQVSPHIMNTSSKQLEQIYDNMLYEVLNSKGIKKTFYNWAINLTKHYNYSRREKLFYRLKLAVANKLFFEKWKNVLGGEIKFLFSIGGKLNSELVKAFNAANIPLIKSYGTTESGMVISLNDLRNKKFKVPSVGKPLADIDVKVDSSGEIILKSPSVMMGYYKNPQLTDSVMKNGYYHTGDIGKLDRDGFLTILGRKNRVAKTKDKNLVSPMMIENSLKKSIFIQEAAVFCSDYKSPVAMIQPNFRFLHKWIQSNALINFEQSNDTEMYEVQQLFEEEINRINHKLEQHERISNFELSPFEWTIEKGFLTTAMLVKHDAIKETSIKLFGSNFKKINEETDTEFDKVAKNQMIEKLFEKPATTKVLEEVEEPISA